MRAGILNASAIWTLSFFGHRRNVEQHTGFRLSESRVPDHQEMKWTQLLWRFHEPQGGISLRRLPSRMPKWKFLSTHGGEPMSSKPQFQLAASLSVVSEASGRGILPRVSRYTVALRVLYRLSRPFTQIP